MAHKDTPQAKQGPSAELSHLPSTVFRGVKVLLSELKWQSIQLIRGLEVRQMNKRLMREYQALGEQTHQAIKQTSEGEPLPPPDKKMLVSAKQIDFLLDEIEHLNMECGRMRNEIVKTRSKDLGFD